MKKKLVLSYIGLFLSLAFFITVSFLAEMQILNPNVAVALIVVGMIVVWISIFYLAKVDYETGVYECKKCSHTFTPTFRAYILGTHMMNKRHLKCPSCEEKSWCIRKNAEE